MDNVLTKSKNSYDDKTKNSRKRVDYSSFYNKSNPKVETDNEVNILPYYPVTDNLYSVNSAKSTF